MTDKKELRKNIAAELDKLENEIRINGRKSEFFEKLHLAVNNMELRYTQLRFSGTPNLIWQSALPSPAQLSRIMAAEPRKFWLK